MFAVNYHSLCSPLALSLPPIPQNEAMTGVFDFNPIFSRLTLAVLQDSGWYTVDYSAAQPLLWGKDRGCGFFKQGCRGQLDQANVE